MTISVGENLPDALLRWREGDAPQSGQLSAMTKGRKVVIFGLPGAFTGTCTTAHVPSMIRVFPNLKAKGVDDVICVSVNDIFAMQVWGEQTGATDAGIRMLADPECEFTRAIGMDFSAPVVGLINRSMRYTMLVDEGVVTILNQEPPGGGCEIAAGETLLDMM